MDIDEETWAEQQRDAGVFKTFEDELRARVQFRHYPKIMRAIDEQPKNQVRIAHLKGRERKPSIKSRVKAAQNAGAKDVDIKPDGTVTAAFGTEPIPNEWDVDLGIESKASKKHLPSRDGRSNKPRGH